METSESVKNIFPALLVAMKHMSNPEKNAKNPHFKSSYANLESVMGVKGPLLDNGILTLQDAVWTEGQWALRTKLVHAASGEYIEALWPLMLEKQTPQGMGSAQTYARRYALLALLDLVPQNDDDGHAASNGPGAVVHNAKGSPISQPQLKRLLAIGNECGWTKADIESAVMKKFGVASLSDLSWFDYDAVVTGVQKNPK